MLLLLFMELLHIISSFKINRSKKAALKVKCLLAEKPKDISSVEA